MSELPRAKLVELVARYELEPGLRDLYVEGDFDIDILNRCCHPRCVVYSIDTVEIYAADLIRHSLTEGRKQRLILLARELFAVLKRANPEQRCLIDRDLDHWFGSMELVPGLIYTAYSSIELYFLSEKIVREIVTTVGNASILNWSRFFDSFVDCLLDLYALRLADRELALKANWPAVRRSLRKLNDVVVFDAIGYGKKVLMGVGAMSRLADFTSSVSKWRAKLTDPRLAIRGHDFIDLLAWTIGEFNGVAHFTHVDALSRILVLMAPNVEELRDLVG